MFKIVLLRNISVETMIHHLKVWDQIKLNIKNNKKNTGCIKLIKSDSKSIYNVIKCFYYK